MKDKPVYEHIACVGCKFLGGHTTPDGTLDLWWCDGAGSSLVFARYGDGEEDYEETVICNGDKRYWVKEAIERRRDALV